MAKEVLQIGIDLGTANTLVYIAKQGIVFNEPSYVAYDKATKKCIACGHSAKLMAGKTHDKIRVVKPLEGGVVADLDATKSLLEYIFSKLDRADDIDWAKSTILLCCPSEITVVERAALINLAHDMGIQDVFIEQEVKAGAVGAGCDIYQTTGCMIADIGGGSTDIGVLSCGDLVVWDSIRVAGRYFDNEIAKYVKQHYNLLIGERTAERLKFELATLAPIVGEEKECEASGRHLSQGQPATVTIRQGEIREIMLKAFDKIKHVILATLERTPPELSADILKNGITINGGGGCIPGIKEYFEAELKIPCTISPNCLTSIVEGTKYLLKNRGNYLQRPVE
ncbi:MAG: rod shape-determining protein [Eubacteriales bacterium]|nr:rod shape-determining protein [Eubacteriales bacterium]